jgi:hypothetical protein
VAVACCLVLGCVVGMILLLACASLSRFSRSPSLNRRKTAVVSR